MKQQRHICGNPSRFEMVHRLDNAYEIYVGSNNGQEPQVLEDLQPNNARSKSLATTDKTRESMEGSLEGRILSLSNKRFKSQISMCEKRLYG